MQDECMQRPELRAAPSAATRSLYILYSVVRKRAGHMGDSTVLEDHECVTLAAALNYAAVEHTPVFVTHTCMVVRVRDDVGSHWALKLTFNANKFHEREISALQALRDVPSVPPLAKHGEVVQDSNIYGALLPWYDTCLFDAVQTLDVTPLLAWSVVRTVASAYCAAHALGFAYMDLKLENVMFNKCAPTQPVLCDWNAAVPFDARFPMLRTTDAYNGGETCTSALLSVAGEAWRLAVLIYAMVYGDFPLPASRGAATRFVLRVDMCARLKAPASALRAEAASDLMCLAQKLASRDEHTLPAFADVEALAAQRVAQLQKCTET